MNEDLVSSYCAPFFLSLFLFSIHWFTLKIVHTTKKQYSLIGFKVIDKICRITHVTSATKKKINVNLFIHAIDAWLNFFKTKNLFAYSTYHMLYWSRHSQHILIDSLFILQYLSELDWLGTYVCSSTKTKQTTTKNTLPWV